MELSAPKYININGQLLDLSEPCVMGIVNVTPDSFYQESRTQRELEILNRVDTILEEGGKIIDIGAYSSRPDAKDITTEEEMSRLHFALKAIRKRHQDVIISVDTFRSSIAERCVKEYGVNIINDISGGELDDKMFSVVAELGVPYIMMHMKGVPQTMQHNPQYSNIFKDILYYFSEKIEQLRTLGAKDIILDPGFGFGKTLDHNYELMAHLEEFKIFDLPLLVGVSRKSMIYKLLDVTPQEALTGTTVLHTFALQKGANILRVHDVREAVQTVALYNKINEYKF